MQTFNFKKWVILTKILNKTNKKINPHKSSGAMQIVDEFSRTVLCVEKDVLHGTLLMCRSVHSGDRTSRLLFFRQK